jgi:hypothetical protein
MNRTATRRRRKTCLLITSIFLPFLLLSVDPATTRAQQQASPQPEQVGPSAEPPQAALRLEKHPVANGAELITISAQLNGSTKSAETSQSQSSGETAQQGGEWVPLVTVLRDTLGDANPENDRLRYVWGLSYTRPSTRQRAASAVPFLYARIGNKEPYAKEPPPLLDLAAPDHDVWRGFAWQALQYALLDPYGMPVRAVSRSYQRNISDYRKSQMTRAISVLSLVQSQKGAQGFSESELKAIQARLWLTDKAFGGFVDEQNLPGFYQKQRANIQDARGHNWELLRQQAENGGLYFEPLEMPDGSATHALIWIAQADLQERGSERFDGRFLNIANPWNDKRILQWQGYRETRYLDADSCPVDQTAPGARPVEMIPLALYGLDNPKIPMLLVDFRDSLNPKRREMSRRALQDVTKNVLGLSQFGDLPFFLGHKIMDFVTGRRGVDINQPSRLRSYAQLKLLLTVNNSLTPDLQREVRSRIERVSLNPIENDQQAELQLAQAQYAALLAYAARPDGLPALLERDRQAELTPLEHGRKARFVFKLANALSFGRYVHREQITPDLLARIDLARSLTYHTRFLREVSRSSRLIEVSWDLEEIRHSLEFISEHGSHADAKAVAAVAEIFSRTQDQQTRRSCLESLSRINNQRAKTILTRISKNEQLDQTWRQLSAQYLEKTARVETPLDSAGQKSEANRGQQ